MVKQKTKKSEKTKVKLKTTLKSKTKFLPKGGNVTNTNFKIRPIVLQEQLRLKDSSETLSKRKLTCQEVLVRLNHHNANVRHSGCIDLLEVLNAAPQDTIELQLHNLLLGSTKLVLDSDSKVRRQAIKLVFELLAKVSNVKLVPFYEILVSYTSCAMTHLDVNIQEDSLLIIDAFLNYTPGLITKYHSRLFPNFLTLISKLRNNSTAQTLTTDLRLSVTALKWRMRVLYRLQAILRAIIKENTEKKVLVKTFLAMDGCNNIPLLKGVESYPIDFFKNEKIVLCNDLSEHVDILLPLLYETWAEVVPVQNKFDKNSMIDYDVAVILSCSLGIFRLLWEYATKNNNQQKQQFLSKKNQKFFNSVLKFFPYQQKPGSGLETFLDVKIEPKLINENLLVCFMFCKLYKDMARNEVFRNKTEAIIQYITMCLVNRNYVKVGEASILLSMLRMMFFDCRSVWSQSQLDFKDLLNRLVHFYRYNQLSDEVTIELFKLLSDITQLPELRSIDSYKKWLRDVPQLLCQPRISMEVLNCISWLSRQCSNEFMESLRVNLEAIMDNLFKIQVVGTDVYSSTLKIVHIIGVLDCFSQHDLYYLNHFIQHCNNDDVKVCLDKIIKANQSC
ncbi:hypothetical protein RN001_010558 [Aquatica leii]|uniref:Pre-rRNA-processing protein Ipi1 N-terminal domain-containing protein n=1 Tax=Aquatica leii TaxID=1421715 RepID=A0AAN7P6R0_9COLE|nr:hypothetical protein RN001_010558 [Aquatica leii]